MFPFAYAMAASDRSMRCTVCNDPADSISEALFDLCKSRGASLIFRGVVQQGSDCLIFVPAIFYDQGRHRHQVGDVWDLRALPYLQSMQLVCIEEGIIEAFSQHQGIPHFLLPLSDCFA
jgi:hypothetical protein